MIAVFLLFAGFVVFASHMPVFLAWIRHLNYMRYTFEGLSLAVYGYGRGKLECPSTEIYCHLRVPSLALQELGIEDKRFWIDVFAIFFMIVFTRAIAYVTLRKKLSSSI